ncbi:hypothetical protein FIBSPDRAFT_814946 [Athelia psychrophila]|uniref:HIT-type domain-containing protein n=1 Tax=Athelia psychrophila TaxID=1759441 RepID=A0A166TI70_9AGAM|nr:hypothetical protein FIBSPDRAFT_814946 [Fibularhizoctonia sp. CBS 109695]
MDTTPIVATEPEPNGPTDTIPCGLCRRQFSKYTCPTCNVGYCSLTCFRSEAHSQCSETFYRKEVESGIQAEPSKSTAEKMQMMELLKRLEKESAEEDPNMLEESEEDEEDDEDDLAQRLEGMDLESVQTEQLWEMLTPEERKKFMKALDNPDSELAQQLLASEELESDRMEPWWEAPSIDSDSDSQRLPKRRFGVKPAVIVIPSVNPGTPQTPSPLIYNILAVFVAYAYATRYLATSPLSTLTADEPEWQEARRITSQLVPFLTDRSSKVLHSNLSSVVTDLWSRFDSGVVDGKMMSTLLHDAARLLRPRPVTILDQSTTSPVVEIGGAIAESHPCVSAILVLSDLAKLFERPSKGKGDAAGQRPNHVTLKLSFYSAQIISTPTVILMGLSEEVSLRSKAIEREALLSVQGARAEHRAETKPAEQNTRPKIEELP